MSEPQEKTGGIFTSLRGLIDGGLALAQNRVELFAVELREEKCRLIEALLWASALIALGMMTLALLTLLVVILFWPEDRVAAVLVLSLLYLLATILAWRGLRLRLAQSTPFSGTLGEFKKDRACLRTGN
ncbi:MAG: phage holin family protein [Verrucomicrobia bacterium]|nr:phage holin family protein [Verrucomicrobiota bacterium]